MVLNHVHCIPVGRHEADSTEQLHGLEHTRLVTWVDRTRQDGQRLLVVDDLHQAKLHKRKTQKMV